MTPTEQRIAIAELCGWIPPIDPNWDNYGDPHAKPPCGKHPKTKAWTTLPDYLNDLNAMHEAENKLILPDMGMCYEYQRHLAINMRVSPASYDACSALYWSATSAQRSEALLRTMGKWKET